MLTSGFGHIAYFDTALMTLIYSADFPSFLYFFVLHRKFVPPFPTLLGLVLLLQLKEILVLLRSRL